MIGQIEIVPGDVGRRHAAPLLAAAWPPEVVAFLPSRDVIWAPAERRVLVFNRDIEVIGHVGICVREAIWNARPVRVGGIGGVTTREDSRRRGVASAAMRRAIQEIREVHEADFALLFCEPRQAPVYQKLGWHPFAGDVFVEQPRGRLRFDVAEPHVFDLAIAPRAGVLDLCGLPW